MQEESVFHAALLRLHACDEREMLATSLTAADDVEASRLLRPRCGVAVSIEPPSLNWITMRHSKKIDSGQTIDRNLRMVARTECTGVGLLCSETAVK